MCNTDRNERRHLLKALGVMGLGGLAGKALGSDTVGVLVPGKGWINAGDTACPGDGTPLQFIPRGQPDDRPLINELEKYPRCPYCGMDRTQWHHSRHLVHYDDGLVDGTCSIHCLAISLSLNIDRGPQAIYVADFGAEGKPRPMLDVDRVQYLVGSQLKGTMTANSKMAFGSAATAQAVQAEQGGTLTGFDDALRAAYLGMADDTVMVRRRRRERVERMMQKKAGMGHGG